MEDQQSKEDDLQQQQQSTFRIRFTISNKKDHENNCDETSDERNHQVDKETRTSSGLLKLDLSNKQTDKKSSFRLIQPQNHKSSLFVNLSATGSNNNSSEAENHLFISPDLNYFTPASPPSPVDSTTYSSSYEILGQTPDSSTSIWTSTSTTELVDDSNTMSQGCNFINTLMSASRRRSASVTPQAQANKPAPSETTNNGRRASSSDDLIAPPEPNPLSNKSSSGNHLAVGLSNETICGNDLTQTNRNEHINNSGYVQWPAMNMRRPLHIDINDSDENSYHKLHGYSVPESVKHPVSLENILQIDTEDRCFEEEEDEDSRDLDSLIEIWEQKVDELERERIARDVPRTLVEKVLKQRKELRELECQLYTMELEESLEKAFPMSRSVSQIKPGQENTADILEAIPPSGSYQHRQYLSKASTGTDFSEYSHVPTYGHHKHMLPNNLLLSSDDSMSGGGGGDMNNDNNQRHIVNQRRHYQSHTRHHQHHHHNRRREQQVYMQLDSPEVSHKPRSSPVRPNHFKDDFRPAHVIISQDSSSTASSSSPH